MYMWDSGNDDPLNILSPGYIPSMSSVVEGLHGKNDFDALKPYFENGIGVWPLSVYIGNNSYYTYFLTLDDGETWSLDDPRDILPKLAKKVISFIEAPKYR